MKDLFWIQQNIKVPKSQYNDFGKFKYRSMEDILSALHPLLAQCDGVITMEDDVEAVGDRVFRFAKVTLSVAGVKHAASAPVQEPTEKRGMDPMQVSGAASSYARKIALQGLLALDDGVDSDTVEEKPKITQAQAEEVRTLLVENDLEEARLVAWMKKSLKCSSIEDLNEDGFDTVIKRIQAAKK